MTVWKPPVHSHARRYELMGNAAGTILDGNSPSNCAKYCSQGGYQFIAISEQFVSSSVFETVSCLTRMLKALFLLEGHTRYHAGLCEH